MMKFSWVLIASQNWPFLPNCLPVFLKLQTAPNQILAFVWLAARLYSSGLLQLVCDNSCSLEVWFQPLLDLNKNNFNIFFVKIILSCKDSGDLGSGKGSEKDFAPNLFEAHISSVLVFCPYITPFLVRRSRYLGLFLQTINSCWTSLAPTGKL